MLALTLWGQQAEWGDLGVVGLLVVLEGVLSIDNALVLGLLAKRLPKEQQQRALTYGLVGAFAFRFIAIGAAAWLLEWEIVKLLGGGYLAYIGLKHLLWDAHNDEHVAVDAAGEPTLLHGPDRRPLSGAEEVEEIEQRSVLPLPEEVAAPIRQQKHPGFWSTVAVIELTDIAFAIDSILAAIGVVGDKSEKLWVIVAGGILGVVLMRFAAVVFIRVLERFPRFETAAYLLVVVIGAKLVVDWWFNQGGRHVVDFHDPRSAAFWVFWLTMLGSFLTGFLPQRKASPSPEAT